MTSRHALRAALTVSALLAAAAAIAQPVPSSPGPTPVPVPSPTPGPAVVPGPVLVPGSRPRPIPDRPIRPIVVAPQDPTGRGSLADPAPGDVARHIKLTLTYDGTRVAVLRSERGDGPPRSYPYQQAELRVEMRDGSGATLRSFTLPDPRQVRSRDTYVREVPVRIPRGTTTPIPAQPLPSDLRLAPRARSQETVGQRAQAQFELFLPDLPEAKTVIVSRGASNATVLARIDLAALR
jgi:hypothetical protein